MSTTTGRAVDARRIALGQQIRARRKAQKYTLKALAAITGLSVPKLCRIELGQERTRLEDVDTLAKALATSTHALIPKPKRKP